MDKVAVENLFFLIKVIRTLLEYLKAFFPGKSLKRMRKCMGWNPKNLGFLTVLIGDNVMEKFKAAYKKSHSKKMLEELAKLYEECCNI